MIMVNLLPDNIPRSTMYGKNQIYNRKRNCRRKTYVDMKFDAETFHLCCAPKAVV